MANKIKLIGLSILVALICWLAFDSSSQQQRQHKINMALKDKKFFQIGPHHRRKVFERIKRLCKSINVTDTILLNEPFNDKEEHKLHFFISMPALASITNCVKGNAVFDASLNTVFIDQSIIYPEDWIKASIPTNISITEDQAYQYIEDDIPFNQVYTEFVIMHELGHYKMGSKTGGLFDVFKKNADANRRDESAADSFALKSLLSHYQSLNKDQLPQNMGLNIGLFQKPVSLENPLIVGLLEMAHMSVLGKLIGLSPISPYSEDLKHPTFILRLQSMLNTILKSPKLDDTLRAKADYTKAEMAAYLSLPSSPVCELMTNEIINTACFGEKELFIVVFEKGSGNAFYKVPFEDWKAPKAALGASVPLTLDHKMKSLNVPGNDSNWVVNCWYGKDKGFVSAQKLGQLFIDSAGKWKRLDQNLPDRLTRHFLRFAFAPQPSSIILGISNEEYKFIRIGKSEKVHGKTLYAFAGATCKAEVDEDSLINKIKLYLHVDSVTLDFQYAKFIDSIVYIPILVDSENETRFGNVQLSVPSLAFKDATFFNTQNLDPFLFDEQAFITVPVGHQIKNFLISKNRSVHHSYTDSWSVWEIFAFAPAKKLGDYSFITALMPEIKSQMSSMFWDAPSLSTDAVQWLPPNKIIVSWNNDAIYSVDLSSGVAKRLFYPGGNEFTIQPQKDGYLCIYAYGTNHLWVFHPN